LLPEPCVEPTTATTIIFISQEITACSDHSLSGSYKLLYKRCV